MPGQQSARSPSWRFMLVFCALAYLPPVACGHTGWSAAQLEKRGVRTRAEVIDVEYRRGDSSGPDRQFEPGACTAGREFAKVRFTAPNRPAIVADVEISPEPYEAAKQGKLTHLEVVYLPDHPEEFELADVNRRNVRNFSVAAAVWLTIALLFTFGAISLWRDERRARTR